MDRNKLLLTLITEKGRAPQIEKYISQELSLEGGVNLNATGSIPKRLIKFLNLETVEKEVIILPIDRELETKYFEILRDRAKFSEPGRGIAFTVDMDSKKVKEEEMSYKGIFVITGAGIGSRVIDIASKSGAKGATILDGSGFGEIPISEEVLGDNSKEVVVFLVKEIQVEEILKNLEEEFKDDIFAFVLDIKNTLGLAE